MLPFQSDNPITSQKDDILKRKRFALKLGESLLEWSDDTSIVLGLYGEWGSGKSSIVNMAIEYFENKSKKAQKQPIVIRFNPWVFSEQNNLIVSFLEQLAKSIGHIDDSKNAKEVSKKLTAYSKVFATASLIPIPIVQSIASTLEKTFKGVGEATESWAEANSKSVEKFKEEINLFMKKLGKKVIIIIDDIDRLNPNEARQVFQLVKQNANFSNTIYILEFDFGRVSQAIEASGFDGKEYIEKIVQVPFHVPMIEREHLESYLFNRIDKIIKPFPDRLWDNNRWYRLYNEGVKNFITSLRNSKRFINGLNFTVTNIQKEVNPIDFIGVECIRLFCPEVYKAISQNKELFTTIDTRDRKETERKDKIEAIFNLGGENKDIIRNIIYELFPQIDGLFKNHGWALSPENEWHLLKRIASRRRFDNYFMLQVSNKSVTQEELDSLLKSNDHNEIKKLVLKLHTDHKLNDFLSRLYEVTNLVQVEQVKSFLVGFLDASMKFPSGFQDFETIQAKISRFCFQFLKKVEQNDRMKALKDIIGETVAIAPIVHLLSYELYVIEKQKDGQRTDEELLFEQANLNELLNCMSDKISNSRSEDLKKMNDLGETLVFWQKHGDKTKLNVFIKEIIDKDEYLVLIKAFHWQGRSYSEDKPIASTFDRVNVESLSNFVSLPKIVKWIEKRITEEVDNEENKLLHGFLVSYKEFMDNKKTKSAS